MKAAKWIRFNAEYRIKTHIDVVFISQLLSSDTLNNLERKLQKQRKNYRFPVPINHLNWLGLQDATRKRIYVSQTPGPWDDCWLFFSDKKFRGSGLPKKMG
jgi:hypothetical protein